MENKTRKGRRKRDTIPCIKLVPRFSRHSSWRWDRYVVPKRRYVTTIVRCVKSRKSADLIYAATEVWSHARYWKLKEEALDRALWRNRFGTDYRPVVRLTECTNECWSLAEVVIFNLAAFVGLQMKVSGSQWCKTRASGTASTDCDICTVFTYETRNALFYLMPTLLSCGSLLRGSISWRKCIDRTNICTACARFLEFPSRNRKFVALAHIIRRCGFVADCCGNGDRAFRTSLARIKHCICVYLASGL